MGEILIFDDRYDLSKNEIPISDRKVEELKHLHGLLKRSLAMEVIHDQIVESHWDYRSKVDYWRMRSISKSESDYVLNHEIRSSLNRPTMNVLNMGKLFLDKHYNESKGKCFASDLTGNCAHKNTVAKNRSDIYDSNIEYVVGCKLRASSQHWTLPVDRFTTSSRYDPKDKSTSVKFGIFYTDEELIGFGTPKDLVRNIDEIDLTKILDGYVFALSSMQELNRDLTDSLVSEARNRILCMHKEIEDQVDANIYDCGIKISDNDVMSVHLDWFKVYDHLKQKHHSPVKYSSINIR